jgi:hypothetical protein
MTKHATLRTLALSLVLASGASQAGLFGKKKAPPPPAPEPVAIVVPVAPPPPPIPPAPIPLEFTGALSTEPLPAPMDRLQSASKEVLDTVQWIGTSKDNVGLPFVVVDKANARVYAFTPHAQLKATAPILLGQGIGDEMLVSHDAPMSAIPPAKRITPAGRYVSNLARDGKGKRFLVMDAKNLISMHIVAKGTPAQRRAERLNSRASDDNRISFGCINVPPLFFAQVVDPDFTPRKGIVYVLPERQTAAERFGFTPSVTPTPTLAPDTAIAAGTTVAPATAVAAGTPVAPATSLAPTASQLSLSLNPAVQAPVAATATIATTVPQAAPVASPAVPAVPQAAEAAAAPVAK